MATQRLLIATIAGAAGQAVADLFNKWRSSPSSNQSAEAVDEFCVRLHSHAAELPVVYFSEWIDHWLMGDQVLGANGVSGHRFQASCVSASVLPQGRPRQFEEQDWLLSRLGEAAKAYQPLANETVVVVVREVLGASAVDGEVMASMRSVPIWLTELSPQEKG